MQLYKATSTVVFVERWCSAMDQFYEDFFIRVSYRTKVWQILSNRQTLFAKYLTIQLLLSVL